MRREDRRHRIGPLHGADRAALLATGRARAVTCDHASTRLTAGQMRSDGSKLQRCLLCGMYRRRFSDGGFGAWHDRATGPEPERRGMAPALAPITPIAPRAEVPPDREVTRRPSQLARVFSAEIVALARQLSAKRLEVDLLAMRLDRAVEDYNTAHGIGAAEARGALAGIDLQGSRVAWRPSQS